MGSSIHDHTDSHCFVKVLDGTLLETRFAWPNGTSQSPSQSADEEEIDGAVNDAPLAEIGQETYKRNGVTYINDE